MDPETRQQIDEIWAILRESEERGRRFERRTELAFQRAERRADRADQRMDRAEQRMDRAEKRLELAEQRMERYDRKFDATRDLVRGGIKMMVRLHHTVQELAKEQRELAKEQRALVRMLRNGHRPGGNGSNGSKSVH